MIRQNGKRIVKRIIMTIVVLVLLLLVTVPLWAPLHPTSRALYNLGEYRARRWWWDQVGMPEHIGSGSISGWVTDTEDRPVMEATILVSTTTGETYYTQTDVQGWYTLAGIPSGSYRPIAMAWGYDLPAHSKHSNAGPLLRIGDQPARFDAVLQPYSPSSLSPAPESLQMGPPVMVETDFPWPELAVRHPLTFTHEGAQIEGDILYTPARGEGPWPLVVVAYPSPAIRWEKATIQFAAAGYAVLAITPDPDRLLDLESHARDLRMAVEFAQSGQLSPAIAGPDFVFVSGSFGSLFGYRALPALDHLGAIVNIGGVSDAFLGVEALYDEDLMIPPPYDLAVASLGRPDRDPGFFMAYSPAFWAEQHPPTLIIHTYEDEVIPSNQSQRLADALANAGVAHELHLYHSDTHYLDPRDPTPEAVAVIEKVLAFVNEQFSQ